ncbi:MAG: sialate O-acetylesterase [Lachnospiraceae bacterium]
MQICSVFCICTGSIVPDNVEKITPYTCAGVIWYQGEEDSLPEYGGKYDLLFARMIERWRKDWEKTCLLFLHSLPPMKIRAESCLLILRK